LFRKYLRDAKRPESKTKEGNGGCRSRGKLFAEKERRTLEGGIAERRGKRQGLSKGGGGLFISGGGLLAAETLRKGYLDLVVCLKTVGLESFCWGGEHVAEEV